MLDINNYPSKIKPTWCPGCGSYGIIAAIKMALAKQNLDNDSVCFTYDVGCSSNMADFLQTYGVHGLHGRSISTAIGLSIAKKDFPIVAIGGDGGLYGEGIEHFIEGIRGNFNITVLVFDNGLYSLTTGQRSPVTAQGQKTKSTPFGNIERPFKPLTTAVIHDASFVARGFAGDIAQLSELIELGMKNKGFSLIDILQPCPSFNKEMSFEWFKERIYKLEGISGLNKEEAVKILEDKEKIATGVIFKTSRKTYDEVVPQMKTSLLDQKIEEINIEEFLEEFK